jgi:hypothetical protein
LSLVPAKATVFLPLALAGLLPLVSLGGVATMHHEEDSPTPIATEQERGAITSPRNDAGFDDGGVLDQGPPQDEGSLPTRPASDVAEPTPDGEEGESEAPGKTEESPGQSESRGRAEGDGQDNADENGRGPDH